jgi:hypothetical protein
MNYNSPEDFIRAMQTAFNMDDYNTAQQISIEAIAHYPDDEGIKNYARKLARPLIASQPITEEQRQKILALQDWVKNHRVEYRGRWVALRNTKLILDAASLDELVERIGEENIKGLFITAVY